MTPLHTIFCPVASVLSLSCMLSHSAERVASERHLSEGPVGRLLICHNRTFASTFSACPAFSRVSSATLAFSKLLEVGRFGFVVLLLNRRWAGLVPNPSCRGVTMSQQRQVKVTFERCSFFEDLLCFLDSRLIFTIKLMVVGTCCHVRIYYRIRKRILLVLIKNERLLFSG